MLHQILHSLNCLLALPDTILEINSITLQYTSCWYMFDHTVVVNSNHTTDHPLHQLLASNDSVAESVIHHGVYGKPRMPKQLGSAGTALFLQIRSHGLGSSR